MKMKLASLVVAVGMLLSAAPLFAHHSFAAEFDESKPVTLRGSITKVEMTNPHGWIYINVTDEDGSVENWAVETGTPRALIRAGGTPETLAPGTEVIVEGWLARDGTPTANGRSIMFSDGRSITAGTSNPTAQ
jgi:hypothetical protein